MFRSDPGNNKNVNPIESWIAIGIVIGCSIGLALGNLALGIGVGLAIGVAIGSVQKKKKENTK